MATAIDTSPTTSPSLPAERTASDPPSPASKGTLLSSPEPPAVDAAAALRREKNRLLIRRFIAIGCTQEALLQKGLDPDLVRECFADSATMNPEPAITSPESPKQPSILSETEDGELSSHNGAEPLRQGEPSLIAHSEAEDGQLENQALTVDRDAEVAMDISSDSDHSRSPPTDVPLSRLSEPLLSSSTRPMPYEPPFQYFQLAHGTYPYTMPYNSRMGPFGSITAPFVHPYGSYWGATGDTGNDISYGDRDTSHALNRSVTDPGAGFAKPAHPRPTSSAEIVTKTSAVLRSALRANATSRSTLRRAKSARQASALARAARLAAHTSFVRNSMECAYISESDNDEADGAGTPSGRTHPMNRLCLEQQPSTFGQKNMLPPGLGYKPNGSNGAAVSLAMNPQSRELLKEHEAKIAEFKAMIRRMETKRGGESPRPGTSVLQDSVSPVSAPDPLMESTDEPIVSSLPANADSQQPFDNVTTSTSVPSLGPPAQLTVPLIAVANEPPALSSNLISDEPIAGSLEDNAAPMLKVYNETTSVVSTPLAPARSDSPENSAEDALVSAESLAQLERELAQQEDRARDSFQREKDQLAVVRELQSLLHAAEAQLSEFSAAHHNADTQAQSLRQQILHQRKVLLRQMAKPSTSHSPASPALGGANQRSELISKLKRKMDSLKQEHDTLRSTKHPRTEPPPETAPTLVKPVSTAVPRFMAYLMQWAKQHPFDRYVDTSEASASSAKRVLPNDSQSAMAVASSLPSTVRPFLVMDNFYDYDHDNWLWPTDVIDLPALKRQSEAATPNDTRFKASPPRAEIAKVLRNLNPAMATGDTDSMVIQLTADPHIDLGLTSAGSVLRHFRSVQLNSRFQTGSTDSAEATVNSLTYSSKIDPNIPLCLFEASGGECRDTTCKSMHFRDLQADDDEHLLDLLSYVEGGTEKAQKAYRHRLLQTLYQLVDDDAHVTPARVAKAIMHFRRCYLGAKETVLIQRLPLEVPTTDAANTNPLALPQFPKAQLTAAPTASGSLDALLAQVLEAPLPPPPFAEQDSLVDANFLAPEQMIRVSSTGIVPLSLKWIVTLAHSAMARSDLGTALSENCNTSPLSKHGAMTNALVDSDSTNIRSGSPTTHDTSLHQVLKSALESAAQTVAALLGQHSERCQVRGALDSAIFTRPLPTESCETLLSDVIAAVEARVPYATYHTWLVNLAVVYKALTCGPQLTPLWLALLDLVLWAWQHLPPMESSASAEDPTQDPWPIYRTCQSLFQAALEKFPRDTRFWWRYMGWQSDPQRRDHHLCQMIYHFAVTTSNSCRKQIPHASHTVAQATMVLLQLRLSSTDSPNAIFRWMYQLLTAPNLERFLAIVLSRPDQVPDVKRPMVAVPASAEWIKTQWSAGRLAYLWLGYLHARAFGALSLHMFFDSTIGYFVPSSQQLFYIDWARAWREPWDASVLTMDAWDEIEELLHVLSATFSHFNAPTYAAMVYNYVGLMQARAYPMAGIVSSLKTIKHGESPRVPETQELIVRLEATGFAQGQALDEVYFQRVIVHFPQRLGLWNRLAKLVWRRFHDKVRLAELLSRAINVLYTNRDPIKNEWKFLESTLILHLGLLGTQVSSTIIPNIPQRLRRKVFALDRTGDQPLDVTATELAALQAQAPVIAKDAAAMKHNLGNTKQLL
ncbi:hypothetical protein H4R35_002507, partial [Dimargaris xerosporica]